MTDEKKKDDAFDLDFWNKYFDEESKKEEKKPENETSQPLKLEPKKEDKKEDDFDWLKDLIDEIDKEDQEKKKQQVSTVPAVQPSPGKPNFTSKLRDRPRPPPPPDHIRNWGKGQKNVLESGIPTNISDREPSEKRNIGMYFFSGIFLLFLTIVSIAYIYHSTNAKKCCYGACIIMTKIYSGDKVLLDINHIQELGKDVIEKGYIDGQILNLMYQMLKPGDKVIDVGSGFGYYTMYLARVVGDEGKVYSIEGRKDVSELLKHSIKVNDIKNVELFNKIAFSKKTSVFVNTEDYQGRSNFGVMNLNLNHGDGINDVIVESDTLDDMLKDVKNISLIHINAHGSELSILLGAKRIIAQSPNIKIITSWHKHQMAKYVNVHNVVQQLLDVGFRFWLIKLSSGALVEISNPEHIMQVEGGRFIIARSLN